MSATNAPSITMPWNYGPRENVNPAGIGDKEPGPRYNRYQNDGLSGSAYKLPNCGGSTDQANTGDLCHPEGSQDHHSLIPAIRKPIRRLLNKQRYADRCFSLPFIRNVEGEQWKPQLAAVSGLTITHGAVIPSRPQKVIMRRQSRSASRKCTAPVMPMPWPQAQPGTLLPEAIYQHSW